MDNMFSVSSKQVPSVDVRSGNIVREGLYNKIEKDVVINSAHSCLNNSSVFSKSAGVCKLPSGYKDFFAQGVFSLGNDGRYYLFCENDSVHKFIMSFDGNGGHYSVSMKDYHQMNFVYNLSFINDGNFIFTHNCEEEFRLKFIDILDNYKNVILKGLKFKTYCLFANGPIDTCDAFILSRETNLNNGYTVKVFCNANGTVTAIPVYDYDKDLFLSDKLPKIATEGSSIMLEFE